MPLFRVIPGQRAASPLCRSYFFVAPPKGVLHKHKKKKMVYNTWVLLDIMRPFLDTGSFMVFVGGFFGLFCGEGIFPEFRNTIEHLPCGSFIPVGDVGNNNTLNKTICNVVDYEVRKN